MITFKDLCEKVGYSEKEMANFFVGTSGKGREFRIRILCAAGFPNQQEEARKAIDLWLESKMDAWEKWEIRIPKILGKPEDYLEKPKCS